jgi:hypothetical protein
MVRELFYFKAFLVEARFLSIRILLMPDGSGRLLSLYTVSEQLTYWKAWLLLSVSLA